VHDAEFFPIYSGAHQNVWVSCTECHINENNFQEFSCIVCHKNPDTDDIHQQLQGYRYNDNACLGCHPAGDGETAFNHDATRFPLTGAHVMTDCISCHQNGYQGTPMECDACHNSDYDASINPVHADLNLSRDCATCHTTAPGWAPATFSIHSQPKIPITNKMDFPMPVQNVIMKNPGGLQLLTMMLSSSPFLQAHTKMPGISVQSATNRQEIINNSLVSVVT